VGRWLPSVEVGIGENLRREDQLRGFDVLSTNRTARIVVGGTFGRIAGPGRADKRGIIEGGKVPGLETAIGKDTSG